MKIKVIYSSVDGVRKCRNFKTQKGARRFAQKWVGETPEIGNWYAISSDGIGKITANIDLFQLFPKA